MKIYFALFVLLIVSGCTHVGISNEDLLKSPDTKVSNSESHELQLNIYARTSCNSSHTGVNTMTTTCSNRNRIHTILKSLQEHGIDAIPGEKGSEENTPYISVQKEEINGFLEGTTGLFNFLTFGLSPLYSYKYLIVTYKDPINNVDISNKVKISSTTSWFSLFLSNPNGLSKKQIESIAEQNLIRSVVSNIKVHESPQGL